jgi:tetratricopeptide (TPR) repeat protein
MKSSWVNFKMRKFLIFQILLILFLLTSFAATSYGQGKFSQYYNKGIEYYKQGKYDQAGEQFKKALELKPNHVYALYGLGNTHYCKAKYDEAVKIYTNAIKINPDYPKVHYSLSLAYSKLGMTRDAEKEKEIFRKLTQGEKSVVKTPTKKRSKAVREVKKDRVVETKRKSILQKKVYVKKYKKAFKTKLKPLSYIKEKWSKSGINKILICTFGYIFATQMWLCVVAFFGLIIWKIRKKTE